MAFAIEIFKVNEDVECVYYNYEFSCVDYDSIPIKKNRYQIKNVVGKVKLYKISGEIDVIEYAEGDTGAYVMRVMMSLRRHWRNHEYPDHTYWAS